MEMDNRSTEAEAENTETGQGPQPSVSTNAKVLPIASIKGGAGKTTLACTLAAMCANAGYRTAIVDCDPNNTAWGFGQARSAIIRQFPEANLRPIEVVPVKRDTLDKTAEFVLKATNQKPSQFGKIVAEEFYRVLMDVVYNNDRILIDIPGNDMLMMRVILDKFDDIVVPFQPNTFDLSSLADMNGLVRDAIRSGREIDAILFPMRTNRRYADYTSTMSDVVEAMDFMTLPKGLVYGLPDLKKHKDVGRGLAFSDPAFEADDQTRTSLLGLYREAFGEEWIRRTS